MKYKGKRVLLFGTTFEIQWIAPILHENGAYLFYVHKEASSGTNKDLVDEYADIDFHDVEKTISYCLENRINAVISDSNEENIEICRIINERIGNPFFYTEKQWNTFCIKDNFTNLCAQYGIRTPKVFFNGTEEDFKKIKLRKIRFPVVTKPVDSCGGRGCYKCNNILELILLAKHSFLNSKSKRIIIEECLKGQEPTLTFAIQNRVCRMISATDRYVKYRKQLKYNIHSYFVSPSKYSSSFIDTQFKNYECMLLDQGLNNCSIFVQGFFVKSVFVPLEASLRLEGTLTFINNRYFNNQNFWLLSIDNILKVKSDYDITKDDYLFNNKICLYCASYLKEGTIASIKGVDEIRNMSKCYNVTIHKKIGRRINNETTIGKVFSCFNFSCDTYDEARKYVKFVNKTLKVKDEQGKNQIEKPRKVF